MSNEYDNRRSFRVSEMVYIKFEKLSELDFQAGLEHRKLKLGLNDGAQAHLMDIEARLSEAMYLLNSESEIVGRCMTLLNDKLNVVVNQMPALRETRSALAKLPPQRCDVSADGLVFSSEQTLKVGDTIHLQFLLSSDNRYVETFATVVRLTDPPDDSQPALRYGIGVEFNGMPPEQREILIQHMFNLESETLRMRRLKIEQIEQEKLGG
ncbi:MAG: PilZ domain-containing protein [Pseudomonadota bacterium]